MFHKNQRTRYQQSSRPRAMTWCQAVIFLNQNQNPVTPSGPDAFQLDNLLKPAISTTRSFCFPNLDHLYLTLPSHSVSVSCLPSFCENESLLFYGLKDNSVFVTLHFRPKIKVKKYWSQLHDVATHFDPYNILRTLTCKFFMKMSRSHFMT